MTNKIIPQSPSARDYADDPVYQAQAQSDTQSMFAHDNPFALFAQWLGEARDTEINDPNAMALATCDHSGLPDVRMVLLKDFDDTGFVWYSHKNSAKGRQLADNPQAALNFHWKSLRRAVRVRGSVEPVTKAEIANYFSTRARDSRIGAWASDQSAPMESADAFKNKMKAMSAKFAGLAVPLPPGWTGWRLRPISIEFWHDRPFRLHDRLLFSRQAPSESEYGPWTKSRLYP